MLFRPLLSLLLRLLPLLFFLYSFIKGQCITYSSFAVTTAAAAAAAVILDEVISNNNLSNPIARLGTATRRSLIRGFLSFPYCNVINALMTELYLYIYVHCVRCCGVAGRAR